MSWLWHDQLQDMGLDPEDFQQPECGPPSEIVVNFLAPVTYRDVESGELTQDLGRCWRSFPMIMHKAAWRFADYCRRRYGKGNVWIEYD